MLYVIYYYYLPYDDEKKQRSISIIRVYNTINLGIVYVKQPYLYFNNYDNILSIVPYHVKYIIFS